MKCFTLFNLLKKEINKSPNWQDREIIKQKAVEILGDVKTEDAYMYENKEGVRVFTDNWKIDILPHSVHIWTEFDENVTAFCNWLMENAYEMKKNQ